MLGFGPLHRPFDLFRANLSGQMFVYLDLRKANLWLATLDNATLNLANLSDADLNGASLNGARLPAFAPGWGLRHEAGVLSGWPHSAPRCGRWCVLQAEGHPKRVYGPRK